MKTIKINNDTYKKLKIIKNLFDVKIQDVVEDALTDKIISYNNIINKTLKKHGIEK